MKERIIRVLLPLPFGHGFDYRLPEGMEAAPGDYLRVPFGKKEMPGVAWGTGSEAMAEGKLKTVLARYDLPPMPEAMREFLAWVARYNLAEPGAVLKMALPLPEAFDAPKRKVKRAPEAGSPPPGNGGKGQPPPASAPLLNPAQAAAASALCAKIGQGYSATLLDGVTGSGKTEVYFDMIEKALAAPLSILPAPFVTPPSSAVSTSSDVSTSSVIPAQAGPEAKRREAESILSIGQRKRRHKIPACAGMTRVEEAQTPEPAQGPQILVLLPEIALSHQWLARFESRFGFRPHVWHSEVARSKKKAAYRDLVAGRACVMVGARSALFLPYRNLRLIVVDEEHEPSFKQEDGVFYQARDMAVARAHAERVPILLVSATPSLETVVNVERGRYAELLLPERHQAARMPDAMIVDMKAEALAADRFISAPLQKALAETLAKKQQSLLFLNRRGYAPLVLCRACGHRFQCKNCTAWLVMHGGRQAGRGGGEGRGIEELKNWRNEEPEKNNSSIPQFFNSSSFPTPKPRTTTLRCHHCDHREPAPKLCPECGSEDSLHACGPGIERLAEEVRERFPEARIAVMSSDGVEMSGTPSSDTPLPNTPSPLAGEGRGGGGLPFGAQLRAPPTPSLPRKGGGSLLASTLAAIERGEIDIVIGTQMLAKGHHFPGLALVGIIDADLGLSGGDLRAGERTFQLLQQIAGRAGREARLPGRVLVQSYFPDHPVLAALVNGDRDAFLALEKAQRKASGMPPYGRLAALILDGSKEEEVRRFAASMAALAPRLAGVDILGPAPAPITLLRGRWRYRFLIRADAKVKLQEVISAWLAQLPPQRAIRVRADIDPQSFY